MQINRNNYEAYLLDYWEGNLDQEGLDGLALFFRHNPDLKKHFREYEDFQLHPDEAIVFDEKDNLKKIEIRQVGEINQGNYEEWIIAAQEGDLSPSSQKLFDEFVVANPVIQQEISLYAISVLKADEAVVYHPKEALKKSVPFFYRQAVLWPASIAAMLIIIFGIFGLLKNESQTFTDQPSVVAEEIISLDTRSPEEMKNVDGISHIYPIIEVQIPINNPLPKETEIASIADARQAEILENPKVNIEIANSSILSEQVDLISMKTIAFNSLMPEKQIVTIQIQDRLEMSSVFEYMILRDAMNEEFEIAQKEKSTLGRVFAHFGNKIFGGPSTESPSLLKDIKNKGKASFNELAEAIPVYSESDETGRKSTYFALSENLKFRISKNKNKQEAENRNGAK